MKSNSPSRSLLPRPNTIKPMIRSNKVTTRISHNRTVELLEGLNDILSETILVRQGISGVVDAAVDAATHVPVPRMSGCDSSAEGEAGDLLCETAIDVILDLGDDGAGVY
jgi:hypothetical protein